MLLANRIVLLLLQIISLSFHENVKVSGFCPYNPTAGLDKPCSSTVPNPDADFCNLGPIACNEDSKYRSLDGSCNNLDNPQFGIANYKYARLLPSKYKDGISQPTLSLAGEPLPNARLISLKVFGEADVPDPDITLMTLQWAQVVSGDVSRTARGTFSKNYVPCCTREGRLIEKNPEICFNLEIPPEDLDNIKAGNECMDFVRTLTDEGSNCNYNGGPVEQLNAVTSYLDMSVLYGNTYEITHRIRSFQGGRLIVEERNGHPWLPKNPNTTVVCDVEKESDICYTIGDIRVNSMPGITMMGTMSMREHNRIADELAKLNPHWPDEVLFQEAKRIVTAEFQQITYYELLPMYLGRENMLKNKLIYDVPADSYVNDYDPKVDATTLNEFTTGAFRHYHTTVEGRLDLFSEKRDVLGSLRLSDWFNRPGLLEVDDNYDSLFRGLGSQSQQKTDINIDKEIKHYLFKERRPFGSDMRAIDIHRGRDHGLASYNDLREFCGNKRAKTWEDLADLIDAKIIDSLKSLYKTPDDIDLIVGGALEETVVGTLAGPTFLCIMTEQFYRTRVGDRFFFENENPKTGFTKDQLSEIRKASSARVMCDNGNNIQTMQPRALIKVSEKNAIVPCAELPKVDLSKWIERDPTKLS